MVTLNERDIEIERAERQGGHRRVRPASGVSYESLFRDYVPADGPMTDGFPEDMAGAEAEDWIYGSRS